MTDNELLEQIKELWKMQAIFLNLQIQCGDEFQSYLSTNGRVDKLRTDIKEKKEEIFRLVEHQDECQAAKVENNA